MIGNGEGGKTGGFLGLGGNGLSRDVKNSLSQLGEQVAALRARGLTTEEKSEGEAQPDAAQVGDLGVAQNSEMPGEKPEAAVLTEPVSEPGEPKDLAEADAAAEVAPVDQAAEADKKLRARYELFLGDEKPLTDAEWNYFREDAKQYEADLPELDEVLPDDISASEAERVLVIEELLMDEADDKRQELAEGLDELEAVADRVGILSSQLVDLLSDDELLDRLDSEMLANDDGSDATEKKGLAGWLARRKAKRKAKKQQKKANWRKSVARGKAAGKSPYGESWLGKIEAKLDENKQKEAQMLEKRKAFLKRDALLMGGGLAATIAGPIMTVLGPIAATLGVGSGLFNSIAAAGTSLRRLDEEFSTGVVEAGLGVGGRVREKVSGAVAEAARSAIGTPEFQQMLGEEGYRADADANRRMDRLETMLEQLLQLQLNQQQNKQ